MASSSDPYDGLTRFLSTLGAALVFLLGLCFVLLSAGILKDASFQALNNMIETDAAWAGQPALAYSIDKALAGMIVIGSLAMIAACVGCCGAQLEHHSLICTYFLLTVVLGMSFLITFISVLNFNSILVPIADRQATQFCNVTNFYTFKAELGCKFPASRPGEPCGVDCQNRVQLLKDMDGCNLLNTMCHAYDFQPVGPGLCLTTNRDAPGSLAIPATWRSDVYDWHSSLSCRQACNDHVSCSSFAHNAGDDACFLVSHLRPVTRGNWTELPLPKGTGPLSMSTLSFTHATSPIVASDGQIGYVCEKKDQPLIITEARTSAWFFAVYSAIAALILCLAMCCTCGLLYTTSTRRKGKKGAGPLMYKLLCPWCIGKDKRKLNQSQFEAVDDEDDEEDEEAYD